MKIHIDNITHKLFPKIDKYLSGTELKEERHNNEETLKKFKSGTGTEQFFDE